MTRIENMIENNNQIDLKIGIIVFSRTYHCRAGLLEDLTIFCKNRSKLL